MPSGFLETGDVWISETGISTLLHLQVRHLRLSSFAALFKYNFGHSPERAEFGFWRLHWPWHGRFYSETLLDAFKISVCFSDNGYVFGFFFDAIWVPTGHMAPGHLDERVGHQLQRDMQLRQSPVQSSTVIDQHLVLYRDYMGCCRWQSSLSREQVYDGCLLMIH